MVLELEKVFKPTFFLFLIMVEAMIVLSKEETSSKVKKLEQTAIQIFQEFNVVPQGGAATELSFMVDMSEADLKKAAEAIKPYAEKAGFQVEIVK